MRHIFKVTRKCCFCGGMEEESVFKRAWQLVSHNIGFDLDRLDLTITYTHLLKKKSTHTHTHSAYQPAGWKVLPKVYRKIMIISWYKGSTLFKEVKEEDKKNYIDIQEVRQERKERAPLNSSIITKRHLIFAKNPNCTDRCGWSTAQQNCLIRLLTFFYVSIIWQ